MPSPGTGSRGPTVIDAANITVRGTVKAYDKGVSITVREANGKVRTVPLAGKASVYDDLAVGDKVAVRIPLQKPADGKHADRVERQKPPKAAPASKFSQAQTPKS
jgi:translation initiation factor IF-1